MECKFFVGQKVVCIDDNWGAVSFSEALPVVGEVYTVREFVPRDDGGVSIRLVEIINPVMLYIQGRMECTFSAEFFRPATDITIFNEILANTPMELETV